MKTAPKECEPGTADHSWSTRIQGVVRRVRRSRLVAALALSAFLLGLVLAIRNQPELLMNLDWRPLPALLGLYSLSVLLGGLETRRLASTLGGQMSLGEATRLSLLGAMANMLPIPGAAMVRVAGLKACGVKIGRATASTLAIGVFWLALSIFIAALCLLHISQHVAATFLILALVAGIGSLILFRSSAVPTGLIPVFGAYRLGFIAIEASCFVLALLMLGVPGGPVEGVLLAVSGVLASAIGLAPAGFGIREGSAAGLATLISLPVATGFLAATVTRLAASLVVFIGALPLLWRPHNPVLAPSSVSTISRDG
jgi:hypothetical protein